jgi:hypothetical protein
MLCSQKFKTKRGLSVHLARTHNIHGPHGRFSLKIFQEFFPLLEKKRWTKAEKMLDLALKNAEDDEWLKGYIHALSGMIISLRTSYSAHEPYIVSLKEFGSKKLQETKNDFQDLSKILTSKNIFDAAYFQAWKDFTQYTIRKQN